MATRCLIGKIVDYEMVKYIYCHFDGYPEGVGECLTINWKDSRKINALLSKGDLNSLGSKLKDKNKSNSRLHTQFSEYSENHQLVSKLDYESSSWLEKDWWDIEYIYLFIDGKWHCKGFNTDWFKLD